MTRTIVDIIVNEKPITKYEHMNKTYVEGREGSAYSIKIRNREDIRKKVVISVDGLSIIDGKLASENSPGYIIDSYATEIIKGWRTSDSEVAKFVFGDRGKSYSSKLGNGVANVGVIGVLVFDEHIDNSQYDKFYDYHTHPWKKPLYPIYPSPNSPWIWSNSTQQMLYEESCSNSNLGTGFGKETNSQVKSVRFKSVENPTQTILIYYDNRKGLEARGIVINPRKLVPSAFPASTKYCKVV